MLKENWRFISRIQKVGDILIIIAAFFIAYYGRGSLLYWNNAYQLGLPFEQGHLAPLNEYLFILVLASLSYYVIHSFFGVYGSMRLRSSLQVFGISLASSVLVFVILAATLFTVKLDLSRSFIGLFCFLAALCFTVERFVVLRMLRYWRRKGRNFRNVLICGAGEQAVRLAKEISSQPELGIGIRCFAELDEERAFSNHSENFRIRLSSIPNLRSNELRYGSEAIQKTLHEYAIDEVIFTDVMNVMPQVTEMIALCSEQGIRTTLAADLFSIGMVKSGISYFGDMPLIHFRTPPGDHWTLGLKRVFDVLASLMLLILFSPFFLIISILIKLTSPGPVFFKQKRIGLNGRLFSLYKFRSMFLGAEKGLDTLQERNEMRGPVFKIKNDPRITPIGKFLRRFSLDELPQLWNVLRGDMSLVGPRPPIPGEVSLYERRDRRRLSMRPGLTCIWQVSGRNQISDFESWVRLDLEYIDNWSFGRDMMLLLRTIPTVLKGTGS